MSVHDYRLKKSYSQTSIKKQLVNSKLAKTIIILLPIISFSLPATARELLFKREKVVKNTPFLSETILNVKPNNHTEKYYNYYKYSDYNINTKSLFTSIQENNYKFKKTNVLNLYEGAEYVLSAKLNIKSKFIISPGQARLMSKELTGLISRFETTLFTAEALNRNIDVSTAKVIQEILDKSTITSKQNTKQIDKIRYRQAHRALYNARQGLKRFHSLLDQRYYSMARKEWSASKQILLDNYPINRSIAQPEVRAIWLDRGTIVKARSPEDLIPIFDRLAKAGINTVFFETINSGYTIYPSKIAPQQNPLVKGWDPLEAAITLAHERGIELHAWMWTFAAVNQRHNVILDLPRNYLGPVLSKHPDWAMTDGQGSRFHYSSGKVFLDPAHPEVKNYLSSLITEIATKYKVDGIHLDYIRYPFQSPTGKMTYGYGVASRDLFRKQTGFDPVNIYPGHPLWSKWTKFRIEQIDNFVALTASNLKQLRPNLIFSTAVFPMPKRERLMKIQQNWETWVKQEWIDMLVPMSYAKDAEKLHTLTNPLLREFERGKALLLPGIRLLGISEITALDQMQLLRGMSTEGYALFAAENLNSNLTTIFNNTQGDSTVESKQPLPHRQPFDAGFVRYRSLQKEWNFFLTNNPQELRAVTLEEWGKKADLLDRELQDLVDKPSHTNLFSTRVALNSLRRQFPYWMKEVNSVDRDRVQVWQNRLDSLDRLLNYGEKKILNSRSLTIDE